MNVFCVLGQHDKCPGCECECHAHAKTEQILAHAIEQDIPVMIIESTPTVVIIDQTMIDKADEKVAEILEQIKAESELVQCECCPNMVIPKELINFCGMKMCKACHKLEMDLVAANNTPEKQQARLEAAAAEHERKRNAEVPAVLNMNRILQQGREIDSQIKVRTDIFNAQTIAIEDLRKAIDSDASITNKQLALATELDARFNVMKTVIFELNEQVIAKSNEQKALQTYLNQLVLKLRVEEREKFKQHDLTYEPKAAPKPKVNKGPTKKKLDKEEINKYSKTLGLPPSVLTMMCVSRNLTPKQAFEQMQATLKE